MIKDSASKPISLAMTVEQCWQPQPGGSASYIVELSRALAERHDIEGVGVAARHSMMPLAELTPAFPVTFSRMPRLALYELWSRIRWPRIGPNSVSVTHATTWAIPPSAGPLIVTVHDLAFLRSPEHFTARGNSYFRRAIKIAKREADAIIVPSKSTADDCLSVGFDQSKLRVIPHGATVLSRSHEDILEFRNRYKIDKPYIFWCGTIEPRKDLATLITAFGIIAKKYPELELVLVGPKGWGESGLGEQLPKGVESSRVKVLGRLSAEDLHSAYAGADAFCFPSLWEGFGLPVLEAMSHGVPVITVRGTSMAEVGGNSVLLFEPRDVAGLAEAIERALGEDAQWLADEGKARAALFTWERSAELHHKVYAEVSNR